MSCSGASPSSVSYGSHATTEQISPAPFKHLPGLARSVKGIEQEENGADADHCAKDERVPSLPQVDSLDEIVDGWETV